MSYTEKFRPPKSKVCKACKTDKPIKAFPPHNQNCDGRQNKCRACLKAVEEDKKAEQAEYAKQFFTF